MDLELAKKQAEKYDPEKEAIVINWIEEVTGEKFSSSFEETLKDGVLLCKLMNVLKPKSIAKVNASKLPFMQMENINNFLKVAESLGLKKHDSFMTIDLYEGKNIPQVINALFILASIAQKLPGYNGPKVGLKMAEKREINFTEEQLRNARNQVGSSAVASVKIDTGKSIAREVVKTKETGDKSATSQMSAGSVKTGLEFQRSISRDIVKTNLQADRSTVSSQNAGSVKTGLELGSQRSVANEIIKVKETGDTTTVPMANTGSIKVETGKSIANEVVKVPQAAPTSSPSSGGTSSLVQDLEKLASLRDKGILTEEEFQAKKKQLLGL